MACKFADEVIAVSRGLQKYCLSKHKSDITYIPNGVNIYQPKQINKTGDLIYKNGEEKSILENFNLEPNKYILVVSRLVKHKGIHYLIEAFKSIKNIDKFQEYKFVIVGSTAFTQNYQQYLIRLTKDRNDIIFAGIQTGANLDTLFKNAYLFCLPSESEGLSISVLEAMAYGKAVLISNIDENMELIAGSSSTGAIGFDFKNKNILDLTHKLEILLGNPDIIKKVGKKAQQYVKLYHNWEEITYRTERLYKSTVLVGDKIKSRLRLALARYIFFL